MNTDEGTALRETLKSQGGYNQVPSVAALVRALIVEHQKGHGQDLYKFVERDKKIVAHGITEDDAHQINWMTYSDTLAASGTWGSHLEVMSAARLFDVTINVWLLQDQSTGYKFHSCHGTGTRVWHLGFEAERHFHFLIHGSETESIRRLGGHIAAAPSSGQTTPYNGSSVVLCIGVYGNGDCLFSAIGMAAIACGHSLTTRIQPAYHTLQLIASVFDRPYLNLDADATPDKLAANMQITLLATASGYPLGKGSVIFDVTNANLMAYSAGRVDGLFTSPEVVHLASFLDARTFCKARLTADTVRKDTHGTEMKFLQHLIMQPLPSSFEGCTHVIFDSASPEALGKALVSSSVVFVLVNSPTKKVSQKSFPGFRSVKVKGVINIGEDVNGAFTYKQSVLYLRTEVPKQAMCAVEISRYIKKARKSHESAPNKGNVLPTDLDAKSTQKYRITEKTQPGSTIVHTVLPNVAASFHIVSSNSSSVTFLPGDKIVVCKGVDTSEVVTYRGITQDDQHFSTNFILYEDQCGKIGAALPSETRPSPSGGRTDSEGPSGQQIVTSFNELLRSAAVGDVKRNIAEDLSSAWNGGIDQRKLDDEATDSSDAAAKNKQNPDSTLNDETGADDESDSSSASGPRKGRRGRKWSSPESTDTLDEADGHNDNEEATDSSDAAAKNKQNPDSTLNDETGADDESASSPASGPGKGRRGRRGRKWSSPESTDTLSKAQRKLDEEGTDSSAAAKNKQNPDSTLNDETGADDASASSPASGPRKGNPVADAATGKRKRKADDGDGEIDVRQRGIVQRKLGEEATDSSAAAKNKQNPDSTLNDETGADDVSASSPASGPRKGNPVADDATGKHKRKADDGDGEIDVQQRGIAQRKLDEEATDSSDAAAKNKQNPDSTTNDETGADDESPSGSASGPKKGRRGRKWSSPESTDTLRKSRRLADKKQEPDEEDKESTQAKDFERTQMDRSKQAGEVVTKLQRKHAQQEQERALRVEKDLSRLQKEDDARRKQAQKEEDTRILERKRNQKEEDAARKKDQKEEDDRRRQNRKDEDARHQKEVKEQDAARRKEQKEQDSARRQEQKEEAAERKKEAAEKAAERKEMKDSTSKEEWKESNDRWQQIMDTKLAQFGKDIQGMREQSQVDMETRLTTKLDHLHNSAQTAQTAPFSSMAKDIGDITSKIFTGISGITSGAFAMGSGNSAAWAAALQATALGSRLQSQSSTFDSPATAVMPAAAPVDVLQTLREKRMESWTADDVQLWLACKNLQPLCDGARKHYLDGAGLVYLQSQDKCVEEMWPLALDFHKGRFKQELRAAYEENKR
jgi:hypothetical protein